ncbi:ABC transporter ATP-binding protein [Corynebacterium guangdongense]|uniref:ABC-2 type transport system ATP-binding protein n=1 Tax=Corynebacterium guangdongense TaxID=1783348 RepID=A0ABU2A064_9CORY|nr:ABC transporter ATP-binding protein [Corynebacterium guangdongense]MDR7330571.1 ABC-2 type transport system ATP-binding protein [Corynebacterium guangdongense]WJZ19125.1 Daunorubicin/doxorubicin resistance ATP-binding protein DrrA [Corynebacterium guangdongense]
MKHEPVLSVTDLTVTFGDFRAVNGLSLNLSEGSIHGFLGPNGSGKSTTIRTLLGLLHPTSGTVRVLGKDPRRAPEILKDVGYVAGDVALWPNLTGAETFRALESLRGRPSNRTRETELIEAFDLDPTKRAREYSTGNRRKVSLVAALSIDARVLILDEPTAGLDPLMEEQFIRETHRANAAGASVLLSSHILSEVERLCDYVTVIKEGRVVERGDLSQLRHFSAHTVTATLPDPASARRLAAALPNATSEHDALRVTTPVDEVPSALRRILEAGGEAITSTPASLESIFLQHYESGTGGGQ